MLRTCWGPVYLGLKLVTEILAYLWYFQPGRSFEILQFSHIFGNSDDEFQTALNYNQSLLILVVSKLKILLGDDFKFVSSAVKSIFMLITCYSYPWEFVRFFVRFIWIFIISKIWLFLFILKIISTWIFFGWFGSIRINFIWITIFIFTLTRRNILPRTPYSVKDTIIYS